jgi:uncharacterized protein (DUF1015 family)
MADIRPFRAIRYARKPEYPLSNLIAPPYDVLDDGQKRALQARHPNNIVTIDLPFTPPKSVGPDSVYEQANMTLRAWLESGILAQDRRQAMYPYTTSFQQHGRTLHRRGFICLVKLTPFGEDVVPHEKTYPGPIEDRLKLMHATGCQLSPVFGLYNDSRNEVTNLLYKQVGRPEMSATLDGVTHQLWSVIDAGVEDQVLHVMDDKQIYIADGHHRYTTALHYKMQVERDENGGIPLPANHPANYCMFVLVSMQDDGLLILATHRLLKLAQPFAIDRFRQATAGVFDVADAAATPDKVADWIDEQLPKLPNHTFGLYDAASKKLYRLTLTRPDVLRPLEPARGDAWRRLDVAILQRYVIDEVFRPTFNAGQELAKGYTSDASQVVPLADGAQYDVALILKPTPLNALDELGKTGDVMPQKSTFFFPKLATGLTMYPLRSS